MREMKDNHFFVKNRVSLVTPIYNGAGYIHKLLNSILAQDWNDVEIIISDDGSTDNTIDVCETYRERIERKGYSFSILRGEHINASAALGRGLSQVTGEYLIWPDGDDELLPDSISHRVAYLKDNPQYQCVRSLQEYIDFDTGVPVNPLEKTGALETHNLFWDILFSQTYVCCGCYMLRSEAFFQIYPTGSIPIYDVGQNFQMLLPFMYKHECPTLKEILYRVNRRVDSHSAQSLTKEQMYKKYASYEVLIDEIALLCKIKSRAELKRIDIWKKTRQLDLAKRFNDNKLKVKAQLALFIDGEISFFELLIKCSQSIKRLFIKKGR